MHPTIAHGFVQHHQAALHQEARQSRLAAQARAGRTGPSWLDRMTTLAGRLQGLGSTSGHVTREQAAEQVSTEAPAQRSAATAPAPAVDPSAAPRYPASWARTRTVAFGPAGRTLSGPPDVTPPSPAL
jgi:hypothetical protein